MKKKLSSKKCIAIVLAAVMIITSIPFMMVGAVTTGAYDPAPYWGDDATDEYGAINTNFVATLNTDGSVDISFPNANAQKTYNGSSTKTIEKYVFTLTKLSEDGTQREIYSEAFTADAVNTGDADAKYPNNIYYGPGGLESLPDYDVKSTYDVAIMAIDSDGWFSDKIHTLLSDTPYYDMSADFSPNETWVAREMLLFNGRGNAEIDGQSQTNDGKENNRDYKVYSGSKIDTNGYLAETGYNGTGAYRFWIKEAHDGTPYSVQTTWSRSHYDFSNAEEVWFYVDFSRVDVTKIAFSLTANEKINTYWRDGTSENENSQYGTLFSTKAIAGKNTGTVTDGLYIQNADGLWEQTSMTDGYFTDLAGYEGFIRIPIEYFLLQQDQFITVDNTYTAGWKNSGYSNIDDYLNSAVFLQSNASGWYTTQADGSLLQATTDNNYKLAKKETNFWGNGDWEDTYKPIYKLVVNSAGTSVTDAVIIHSWFTQVDKGTFDGNSYRELGYGLHKNATATITTNADGTKTYTVNRDTSPKAISDLISAGFEVAGWSADSVAKSFYLDQVMFCQWAEGATFNEDGSVANTSSVKFPDEGGNFAGDLGKKVAGYYDRTVEVPKAVANYITEYVGKTPSLKDVNALEIIDDIVTTYINCFPGCTTVDQAIAYLNTAGHTEAYNRYDAAKTFIENYINLGDSARNYNAVVAFESGVEKLPASDFADYSDETLKKQLEQLMALYKSFNLSHFEVLGAEAEEKFTSLYDVIMGEEVKTGYSIGGYPYIPFNDFEKNISGNDTGYAVGQQSLLYFDDYPNNSSENTKRYDVNNTKNFTTYVTSNTINQTPAISGGSIGWSVQDYRASIDGGNNAYIGADYFGRMDAEITTNGFAGSLGATINLDGDLNSSAAPYKFAVLSTTYKGQNASEWSNLQGLDLSALAVNTKTSDGLDSTDVTRYNGATPNSFVMYVDFTEVEGLVMNIKFILRDPDGYDVNCYFCAGYAEENPIIYLLDENGEWEEQALAQSNIDINGSWFGDSKGVCSIAPSSLNTLEGYKGFIRIPLSNFRIPRHTGLAGSVVNNEFLDNLIDEATYGNWSIVQAKVAFWDYTGANVGKDVTIDAMGFTYDPACTTRKLTTRDAVINQLNADNGLNADVQKYGIKNMDEYFGVKTNDSVNFEKMVAELDPYEGKDAFVTAYENAKIAYNNLSIYQKGLDEIKHCYNDLLYGKYLELGANNGANYDTLMTQEPWVARYATADELLADLNALDSKATGFDITKDENALTKPYDTETGEIIYTDLGIADMDAALTIVEMYEKGYCRLSGTEKAKISADDFTKLENAYNAANRLLLLEDYLTDINSFKNEIIQIYTAGTAEQNVRMVSYENPDLLEAITVYDDMSVFAKKMILETKDTANAGYANMYEAAEAIYDNSHTITMMSNNEEIKGGVLILEDRMHTCAEKVAGKITARTVLDTDTLNEIEYCLGQTESFLPRYAQVDEINVAYHELADLLPFADMLSVDGDGNEITTITLNNDSAETMKYTAYIDLSYIATRLNRNVDLYAQSDLKWTQTAGSTYKRFDYYYYDSLKGSAEQGEITALAGSYTNGNSASLGRYAYTLSVDATEAAKVPTGAVYTSKVRFYAVDPEVIAQKTADGTTVAEVLADSANVLEMVEVDVVFTSTNGSDPIIYEVEIPAKVQVDWDDSSNIDVSYTVEATLGSNTLSVSVADSGAETGKLVDSTGTYTLDFTTTNFKETTFTGDIPEGTTPTDKPSIKVTGWDEVPVGTYSTQLTYTVDVTS